MAASRIFSISATLAAAVLFATLALAQGAGPAEAGVRGVLDANCRSTWDWNAAFDGNFHAQTFTAVHTGKLTDARVKLSRFRYARGGVVVQIRTLDSSGAPSSTVLASTVIPRSSVSYFPRFRTRTAHFDPASAARVVSGRGYALVLKASRGYHQADTDGDNCPGYGYAAASSGGPWAGGPWDGAMAVDMLFSVYVVPD